MIDDGSHCVKGTLGRCGMDVSVSRCVTYEVVFFEDNYMLNNKLLNVFCVYLYDVYERREF